MDIRLNIDYIVSLKQHIKGIIWNLHLIELGEYDINRASFLLNQMQKLQDILQSLRKITNDTEKYKI
jgi:hypothetical protein